MLKALLVYAKIKQKSPDLDHLGLKKSHSEKVATCMRLTPSKNKTRETTNVDKSHLSSTTRSSQVNDIPVYQNNFSV